MDKDQAQAIEPEVIDQELAKAPKQISGKFRKAELPLPREVQECPGISLFGRVIRSFVFSTDLAIIRNCDADAVLAVYPFTCQPSITQGLLNIAERPVFPGIAGSTTSGVRSVELAMQSEMQGATGVVVNAATRPATIQNVARAVDIPVVVSIGAFGEYAIEQIRAGARIVNVAAGAATAETVRQVRDTFPEIPIIASGGGTPERIRATIAAGADAISWTPPTMRDLERANMVKNRREQAETATEYASARTRTQRDAEVLKVARLAAGDLQNMKAEQRMELAEEGVRELHWAYETRLDGNERQLFRQLLAKIFAVGGADGIPAQGVSAGGTGEAAAGAGEPATAAGGEAGE